MRTPIIAANWKMHKTVPEAVAFARDLAGACAEAAEGLEIVVCAPYTALDALSRALRPPLHLGAQNVHWEAAGAFTGEISAPMLADLGVEFAIVGHSERRRHFGETDGTVRRRLAAALAGGLTPILCVGETREEREAGRTREVVDRQLALALEGVERPEPRRLVVAYEPVWAIGTGQTPRPEEAEEVHREIRGVLAGLFDEGFASGVRIQYGGSVKGSNAAEFLGRDGIDGALVGGASLEVGSFLEIIEGGSAAR